MNSEIGSIYANVDFMDQVIEDIQHVPLRREVRGKSEYNGVKSERVDLIVFDGEREWTVEVYKPVEPTFGINHYNPPMWDEAHLVMPIDMESSLTRRIMTAVVAKSGFAPERVFYEGMDAYKPEQAARSKEEASFICTRMPHPEHPEEKFQLKITGKPSLPYLMGVPM